MKKKRSEKPTLKRRTDDTNKLSLQPDKHHNSRTPCCDLVREIAHELFPHAASATVDTDNAAKENGGKNDESKSPPMQSKEQPLLGFMIQRYLIEQHRKNGHVAADSQQACSAKSRKKKKKKKKSSDKSDSSGVPTGSILEGHHEDFDANGENATNSDHQNNDLPSSDAVNSSPVIPVAPSISVSNVHESTPKPSSDSLDHFLSSIIDTYSSESPRSNRDIESFAAYLAHKYEACIEVQGNLQKNKKSKSNNTSETDLMKILPTIALEEMKTYCSPIECRLCQTSVHSEMKQLLFSSFYTNNTLPWGINEHEDEETKKVVFVLDDQSNVVNRRQNHSLSVGGFGDETAFDYINMNDFDLEAGNSVTCSNSSAFRLEFHPISSEVEENTQYLQIKLVSKNDDTADHFPLTLDNIINLVKSVILPCGIEMKSASDCENHLSDSEFESIVDHSREQCSKHKREFYQIQDLRKQMHQKHEESTNTNNRSAIDFNTSQSMISCDNHCEILLKRVGEFMITITKMTCSILHIWTNEYGPYLMNCLHDCWDQFNVTLDKLIHPTMKYRGTVLQMCQRPGNVPQLYTSKMIRDRFLDYLGVKVAMIDKFVSYLEERLINPNLKSYRNDVHQSPSPLARLCVLNAFIHHKNMSENIATTNIFPNEDDEGEFKKLLAARVVLAQDVIKSPTKSNIETKERENFANVKELYESIERIVNVKESDYRTSPEHIKQCHDRFVLERQKAERDLILDPEHYTPEMIASLMNSSRLLTMQWIYMLCMRQSFSHVEFTLPHQLDDWMESIQGSNIVQPESNKIDATTKCDGSGAKRRVSSVLSSLLYRWLEARCSEWHAELTQNELLTSVDLDGLNVNEEVVKPSKKKKTKKKSGKQDKSQKACPTKDLTDVSTATESRSELNDEVKCNVDLQPSSPSVVDEEKKPNELNSVLSEASTHLSSLPAKEFDDQTKESPWQIQSSKNSVCNGKKKATKTAPVKKEQAKKTTSRPSPEIEKINRNDETEAGKNNIPQKSPELPSEQTSNSSSTSNQSQSAGDLVGNHSNLKSGPSAPKESYKASNKQESATKQTTQAFSKSNTAAPKKQKQTQGIVKESNGTVSKATKDSPSSNGAAKKTTKDSPSSNSKTLLKQAKKTVQAFTSTSTKQTPKDVSTDSILVTDQVGRFVNESNTKPFGSDLQPKIGVIDNDGEVISAEDFLVGRMEALMAEIEEIKSRYTLWF